MSYVLAATGLRREAKLIARPGLVAVACGGHGAVLEAALEARIARERPAAVWSIGIAGALDPGLVVGDIITIAHRAHAPSRHSRESGNRDPWASESSFGTERLGSRFRGNDGDGVETAPLPAALIGVDLAVTTVAAKAALFAATGAAAVDMESHVAARVANRHGLPFGVLRAISDTAHRDLPPAACVPLRRDGTVDLPAVFAALARQPGQLHALIRLARDTNRALRELLRRLDSLAGDGLLGLDLGELGLDVL